jgi:predicted acyl esterase
VSVQHGVGEGGPRNPNTNETVAGPETLSADELAKKRTDPVAEVLKRPFFDEYYRVRSNDLSKVKVPLLSAANWGGQGLHPRGNFEGFMQARSEQKWLEVHGNTHFAPFYTNHGVSLQKRFFGYFLKGENTGWDKQPRVQLQIRHPGEIFVQRDENEWPLARTQWTKFYLHPNSLALRLKTSRVDARLTYDTSGDGLTFFSPPVSEPVEITGPIGAKIYLSSDTTDADVFLVLRVFAPDEKEVVFIGTNDPRTPIGLGWLRASHRKLDPKLTKQYRPYHTHDEARPLVPNEPVELDVEIWPTCIVVPEAHRIALTVRGKDYEYDGTDAALPHAHYPMKGVGPFLHNNPVDRPPDIFGGHNTLHFSGDRQPYVLLPIISGALTGI